MSRGPHIRRPVRPVTPVMSPEELPYICTTEDAGRLLRCTPEKVGRKVQGGEIVGYKEGKEWRIRRSDLLAYIERQFKGVGA